MKEELKEELHEKIQEDNDAEVDRILGEHAMRWFGFGIGIGVVISFLIVGVLNLWKL